MNRIRFGSFVLALAAISSLAGFAIFLSEKQQSVANNIEAAKRRLEDTTGNIARDIGDVTGAAVAKTDSLARLIGTGIIGPARSIELIELLVGHLESSPSVLFLRLGMVSGGYTTTERSKPSKQLVVGASGEGDSISWFDISDLSSPIAHTDEFDPRTQQWYLIALDERGTSWTYGTSSYGEHRESLVVSSPIFDTQGALLGVVSAGIEIALIEAMLDSFVTNEGVWCDIIDRDGRIVLASLGSPTDKTIRMPGSRDDSKRISISLPVAGSNPGWDLLATTDARRSLSAPEVAIGALIGIACIASIAAASISSLTRTEPANKIMETSNPAEFTLAPVIDSLTSELASIQNHSELIGFSPGLSVEQRRDANRTTSAADRAMRILRDLRSSNEIGEPPSFDLQGLVSDLVSQFEKNSSGAIRISQTFARLPVHTNGWETIGEATNISQTLTQLVINAKDAMPDGGVITIAVSKSDYIFATPILCDICGEAITGEWNRVDITDEGVGIPPTFAKRIFEPYLSGSPKRRSGLGLTQVAGTVKRYGGHISVDSTPEVGTTFSLFLRETARHG